MVRTVVQLTTLPSGLSAPLFQTLPSQTLNGDYCLRSRVLTDIMARRMGLQEQAGAARETCRHVQSVRASWVNVGAHNPADTLEMETYLLPGDLRA